MSKQIAMVPLSSIARLAILPGSGRSLAQMKGSADYIINGGFYSMTTGKPTNHLKVNGKVLAKEAWNCFGFRWDAGADLRMDVVPDSGGENYIGGVELLTPGLGEGGKLSYPAEVGGVRGRSAMGIAGDKLVLYCSGDGTKDGKTPEQLRDELAALGCTRAIMLDGGGSSQCDFRGEKISSARRVHNYIAVWLTEEGKKEMEKKRVVLDPGHGVETAGKRSPDGTYLEHEFNLDVARRIKAKLERHGVEVILTRSTQHELFPGDPNADLAARVKISNTAKPDLFVSIHSNAYDPEGDADGDGNPVDWSEASGYLIVTSAAGETAGRNRAARAILARAKDAGIQLHGGGLQHALYYVLRHTNDPAVLIEHGFHTNIREVELLKNSVYRDLLAKVDAQGILDYLGIPWADEPATGTETPEKPGEETACICCPHCGGRLKIEKG